MRIDAGLTRQISVAGRHREARVLITGVLERGNTMKAMQRFAGSTVAAAVLLGLGGCSGMSARDRNTSIGAGVGAVSGSMLTGGSAVGTVGGAAVGGVIGHEIGKDRK